MGPFDPFKTRDDAAYDFGMYIGQKSIDIEEEFASCIYEGINENGNIYYFYDMPRNDLEDHKKRNINFEISSVSEYGYPVAIAHTHGAYDANTENRKGDFSYPGNVASGNDEMSDTQNSDEYNIDYYLVAPTGELKLYVADSGNYGGTLISSDMIVDSRIEIHQKMKNTLLWNLLHSNFSEGKPQDFVNARRNNPYSLLGTLQDLERYR